MAPKKKSQHHHQKSGSRSAPKSAPKLQISAENESRLRRLLLNTQRPAPAPPPPAETESKAQKGKRLRGVYDKLSLEGFTEDQIERALSALSVSVMKCFLIRDFLEVWIHGGILILWLFLMFRRVLLLRTRWIGFAWTFRGTSSHLSFQAVVPHLHRKVVLGFPFCFLLENCNISWNWYCCLMVCFFFKFGRLECVWTGK